MIKKILLAISLIALVALLFASQTVRDYSATGVSVVLVALLALVVLVVGAVVLFITFFLWQTGSLKASGSPKKALPIIGGVIAAIILIILLATGSFSSEGGFPLALWLIVFVPLWAFRVYAEISGLTAKYKDNSPAWLVTLNMVSIYSIIATLVIFILQGSISNWWENVTSGSGKYFLYMLPLWFVLKYILPGTGSGAVKWGGKFATIWGIVIVIGVVATAIGGGGSSKKVYRDAYASAPAQAPAPVVAPAWTLFAEKTVTADDWQEIAVADKTTFYKYRCDGDCENTKIKAGYAELPANSGHTLLISAGEKIYAKGGGTIKVCRRG